MTTLDAPKTTGIFTSEQQELRSSAKRFLADRSPSERVRELAETESGYDEKIWAEIANLGWTGIAIPESCGGLGFGFIELGILLEEMGNTLFQSPFMASVVAAGNAILNTGTQAQRQGLLPGIADGTTRATLAFSEPAGRWDAASITTTATRDGDAWILDGTKSFVIDGHTADLLVVAAQTGDGVELFTVDPNADGVTRKVMRGLDLTRKLAKVELAKVPATLLGEPGSGAAGLDTTLDQIAIALAIESVGGAQWCLDTTVSYARDREQFNRPIGSFQAVKHRLAEMLASIEPARSAAYYACWAAAESTDEVPTVAPLAKSACTDAFFRAAGDAIQLHGGIGFTWEHDCHLYFRRAKTNETLFGDVTFHRELLAKRIGL